MRSALLFIVRTIADLYLLTFLLRFILQWSRASFHNPFAQFVITVTNPLVRPARRLLPSAAGVDVPTLVVLVLLEAIVTWLLILIGGAPVSPVEFVLLVVLRLANLTLWFYFMAILIYVLLSWIGQTYSPLGAMLGELAEPVLRPARRLLPPIGGLDISPVLVMILIQAVRILVMEAVADAMSPLARSLAYLL
jgi:YggT family protein